MAYIYDIADTWAASGTVFTGIKLNVTDTASAAGSLLMDLQVGGVSRASVRKDGRLFGNSYYLDSLNGVVLGASNQIMVALEGAGAFHAFRTSHFMVGSNVTLRWSSDSSLATNTISATDLILARDAANTLAQRNGVNAQAFNLYNTYTDASNYERGFMRWVSNALQIGSDKLGTGAARDLEFFTNGIARMRIASDGTVRGLSGYIYNLTAVSGIWASVSGSSYIGTENSHSFSLMTNGVRRFTADTVGSVQITTALTVATLPATPLVGMMARVTNADAPTVGSTVVGGGAANALCWYNGTNWTVIGA